MSITFLSNSTNLKQKPTGVQEIGRCLPVGKPGGKHISKLCLCMQSQTHYTKLITLIEDMVYRLQTSGAYYCSHDKV